MNFTEFPGSAFFLAFLYHLIGNFEFPAICRPFPGEGFWGPQIPFSGKDEVDMLGSGESYVRKSTHIPVVNELRTVSKASAPDSTLVFDFFVQFYFRGGGGASAKRKLRCH